MCKKNQVLRKIPNNLASMCSYILKQISSSKG